MLELTIRLIASLAVVVGLLLLLARVAGKRFAGREGAPVQVVHRQPLSRSTSVAVVTVGSRVLVVGTTDHQVSLLTELDPEELEVEAPLQLLVDETAADDEVTVDEESSAAPRRGGAHAAAPTRRRTGSDALTGSILSGETWRQAIAAATGKAS